MGSLLAASLALPAAAQTVSCATPGTDNAFLGIQTIRLWPGNRARSQGRTLRRHSHANAVFDPRQGYGNGSAVDHLSGRRLRAPGRGSGGARGGRLVRRAGLSRLYFELPAHFARLPAAGSAARRAARHPDGAGAGRGLPHRSQSHCGHWIFRRRPSGGARGNAVCSRQPRCGRPHRARLEPARFPGAGLPVARRHHAATPRT